MTIDKHELILTNLKLAQTLAKQRKNKIPNVSLDELESAAYMGLVQAAEVYDVSKSDNFSQFALFRILGAIRDYLRELIWGTRKNPLRKKNEILDDIPKKHDDCDNELFMKIIDRLPENNKVALRKYYIDCDKMNEIASFLKINESRVSQIISESKKILKEMWFHFENELYEAAA